MSTNQHSVICRQSINRLSTFIPHRFLQPSRCKYKFAQLSPQDGSGNFLAMLLIVSKIKFRVPPTVHFSHVTLNILRMMGVARSDGVDFGGNSAAQVGTSACGGTIKRFCCFQYFEGACLYFFDMCMCKKSQHWCGWSWRQLSGIREPVSGWWQQPLRGKHQPPQQPASIPHL